MNNLKNQLKEKISTLSLNEEQLVKLILPISTDLKILNLSVAEMGNDKNLACLIYILLDEKTKEQFLNLLEKYIKEYFDIPVRDGMKQFLEYLRDLTDNSIEIEKCLDDFTEKQIEEILKEIEKI